jgi:predicted dehydrogenase
MSLGSVFQAFKHKKSIPAKNIRIGLIGAGRMGQIHARLLSKNPGADFVGIADADSSRSEKLARKYKTSPYSQAQLLLGQVDAVVIAVPTQSHYAMGKLFLEAGVHCLIEKPLASNISEADELVDLGQRKNLTLQVGHIERFNPAVMEAAHYIKSPQFIEVNRLGPYDPRVAGIGVVMDLMIHDLDIVLFLVGSKVTRVEAFGAKVMSDHEDIAKVRLHFANGCIADLSASRISLKKYRYIRIFQKDSYLSLDYAAPQLRVYRKKSPVLKSLTDVEILKPKLSKEEPLALELDHFLQCVREGKTPLVSGKHGRDALELAREVLNNLKFNEGTASSA